MPDERDQVFARDVFNASLTLMSILVVVITFLAVEYKDARRYAPVAGSIYNAIVRARPLGQRPCSTVSPAAAMVACPTLA
jgi:hypothetical protein